MTKDDILKALDLVDETYVKSIDVFYRTRPNWRSLMKRSVKFAVTAAAVVLTVGVIAIAMLLQSGAELEPLPAAGEESTMSDEKVIHLVTDLGKNAEVMTGVADDTVTAQYALDQALLEIGNLPDGYRVEVEVLPTVEADYQSRLTSLRTEIMSGKGPDVFVLSTDDLVIVNRPERLFPDAQKTMADNYFLPLDDYIENARFMEFDKMNPVIMEAGCTPEGRFVLPMRYTYGAVRTTAPVSDNGLGWHEVVNGTDEQMASLYAAAAKYIFHTTYSETVDYESRALLFSKEELYDSVAAALTKLDQQQEMSGSIRPFEVKGEIPEILQDYSPIWDTTIKDSVAYLPLRNKEGGVSATVTSYIAINNNTPYPDEAFHVVDVIMSKIFQSGAKFWDKDGYRGTSSAIEVFSWSKGVSVYDELMQEDQPLNYDYYVPDDLFPVYCELRDKITDARIRTNVDQALDDLFYHAWFEEMTPGDELQKYVSKEYDKMFLMVGEL